MRSKNSFISDLEAAIGESVQAGWLYGSSENGFNRSNSDIDALFVSNSIQKSIEVHGIVPLNGKLKLIEFRVYSELELLNKIEAGHLPTLLEIARSSKLGVDLDLESKMIETASEQRNKIWNQTLTKYKDLGATKLISMMQLAFTEGDDILADCRLMKNRLAWTSRFQHFILLFISNAVVLDALLNPSEVSAEIKRTYLYLIHLNSVRCLDYDKFDFALGFKELLQKISEVLVRTNDHKEIFSLFGEYFKAMAGEELFVSTTNFKRIVI